MPNIMSTTNAKLHVVIYVLFLFTELVDSNDSDSLTLNTMLADTCSRSLSKLLFGLCTGKVAVKDLPKENLSKIREIRGKRASLTYRRMKRQIADECCLRPCTVAQLIEYCPDTW